VPADPWLILAAAGFEAALGRPANWRAGVSHPVAWLAWEIQVLEKALNHGGDRARRLAGAAVVPIVAGGAAGFGWGMQRLLAGAAWGLALTALLGAFALAARSLYEHVAAVAQALEADDLPAARSAVARIVGRDTEALDREGVAAAALESLAESFNDGVVAPVFWFLLGGLGGLFAYKAVNTADSLIGHKEAPYRHFGWTAARTDDLMNLIPARIAGLLLALVARRGWRVMLRDAPRHASPNAGWPEAAMAGALQVRLGGPATYDGLAHERPVFGEGAAPGAGDLRRGLRLYLAACAVLAVGLGLGGLAWPR
jgi:adenosylcobinamide-phosphate synthase